MNAATAWTAEATETSLAELQRLRKTGAVIAPVRPSEVEAGLPPDLLDVPDGVPDGAFVIRTSGSTGRPRRIVLPAHAFDASTAASTARLDLRADDVWWASLSPAHVGGLALLLRAERLGSGLELTGGFDPHQFWRLCGAGRITHASLVPTMLRRILEARPSGTIAEGLRAVLIGGAAADPDLLGRAAAAGIPVATTWGMTETGSQVATATPAETRRDPTHAGRPLSGVGVRTDAEGRLEVRTPTLALGEILDGVLRPLAGDDGWFGTDDLGYLDDDGFVRLTGRVSDRIITGGVNVDPLEVERVIAALPWVDEVAVVGLADAEWGERVVAAVVTVQGGASSEDGPGTRSAAELAVDLPDELGGARRPKAVVRLAALPRTASGKVDRPAVRRALEDRGA